MSRAEHLITVPELQDALDGASVRLLDVRWRLGDDAGEGERRYAEGHLPGARFLDLESVLTGHTGNARDGRHPLPDQGSLERGLGALGVRAGDDLVVYDEPGTFAASRAWWVLRWAGLRARVLDGGLRAWVAAGLPLERGRPPAPTPTVVRLRLGGLETLDADGAAAFPNRGVLLDARAPERYRGEVEPLDPRAGHVPGAVNAPAADLFDEEGRLPDAATLEKRLGEATAGTAVAAYCGSGVSAAHTVLAMATLGHSVALFPGSWSAWSNDPDRPVATGPDPGS